MTSSLWMLMGRQLLYQHVQIIGKSIKQLAGIGAVYIRLTKKIPSRVLLISDDSDFEPSRANIRKPGSDSDSSFELPPFILDLRTSISQSADSVPPTTPCRLSTTATPVSRASNMPDSATDVSQAEPITPLNNNQLPLFQVHLDLIPNLLICHFQLIHM